MEHQRVHLNDCTTVVECIEAMDNIEFDQRNYDCTPAQWRRGVSIVMYKGAQAKYNALYKKMESLEVVS